MGKETYYFSHDYDPTGDPKMAAMLSEYGGHGYGCFWRITEMLHSDEKHRLPLKKYIFLAIAKQMLTSAENIEKFIKNCIEDYELFISDGVLFWSNRVDRNLGKRAEISEKRANAGRIGGINKAIAKQNIANAKQNVAKERKGKEIKEKEKKEVFISPTVDEVKAYFLENGYSEQIGAKAHEYYDTAKWVDSKGSPVKNWKQKMISVWFKDENKIKQLNGQPKEVYTAPKPRLREV